MSLISWARKEVARMRNHKPRGLLLPPTPTSVQYCLPMPPVEEVVIAADIHCAKCQMRVADAMSKMDDMESVVVHVSEKKITISARSATK